MGTAFFKGRVAVIALMGAAFTSACAAQDNTASTPPHTQMIRVGQSNVLIALPDTTPAPAAYAFTGEQSQSRQNWQKQAGPVYQFGNGSIVVAPSR